MEQSEQSTKPSNMEALTEGLSKPLPRDAVQQRQAFSGTKLSYVSGHYVTNALNEVFGPLQCSFYEESFDLHWDDKDERGRHRVSCVYRGYLHVSSTDEVTKSSTDVGVGHGISKNKGEAIESAVKEARTDCLKRCAKDLGPYMGLALYDKAQAQVAELSYQSLIDGAAAIKTRDDFDRWCYLVSSALARLDKEQVRELKKLKKEMSYGE